MVFKEQLLSHLCTAVIFHLQLSVQLLVPEATIDNLTCSQQVRASECSL